MITNLITGGAGFIGSHLTEALIKRGERVIVLDDLSTGSKENLTHLRGVNLELRVGNVLDHKLVSELTNHADRVFHLAAAVGVQLIVARPAHTIETNIHGTSSVLHACAEHNKPVFIASTSEAYGKSPNLPLREDGDMLFGATSKARWSYACSKAVDEFMGIAYKHDFGIRVSIARFFNTCGPRQTGQYGMVIPRFVAQALKGEPITVYGDGNQSRCFSHVKDIVPAVIKLMETEECSGEVVNIGSTERVTILELAEMVKAVTNSSSEILSVPFEEAYNAGFEDIESRVPDLSKAQRLIGYKTVHNLNDILNDVISAMSR